jgi:hypothetical protein
VLLELEQVLPPRLARQRPISVPSSTFPSSPSTSRYRCHGSRPPTPPEPALDLLLRAPRTPNTCARLVFVGGSRDARVGEETESRAELFRRMADARLVDPSSHRQVGQGKLTLSDRTARQSSSCRRIGVKASVAHVVGPALYGPIEISGFLSLGSNNWARPRKLDEMYLDIMLPSHQRRTCGRAGSLRPNPSVFFFCNGWPFLNFGW